MIIGASLRKQAGRDASHPRLVPFQRDTATHNHLFNCQPAPTLEALADRMGFDRAALSRRGGIQPCRAMRSAGSLREVPERYSVDQPGTILGFGCRCRKPFPDPVYHVSGWFAGRRESRRSPEQQGAIIAGLYAAGRNAIGVCSNIYVSGLSYAASCPVGARSGISRRAEFPSVLSIARP